uniref:VWFA domain-containing protein n=1 Tax=Otus sunia TaxID=257818 RepID=A0A8C8E935_9STRI
MKTFITQVMRRFESTDTHFALMQFSSTSTLHFDFATFARLSPAERVKEVQHITQSREITCTASAIRTVVRDLFILRKGAREGAHRILIVVTDGRKYGDTLNYEDVIPEAVHAGIIRYAIGVGSAFVDPAAEEELRTIASKPSEDHVFRVDNFDALQGIQNQLQEKIFAIEGTQSAHSSSFQLEMAQEGFSALLTPVSVPWPPQTIPIPCGGTDSSPPTTVPLPGFPGAGGARTGSSGCLRLVRRGLCLQRQKWGDHLRQRVPRRRGHERRLLGLRRRVPVPVGHPGAGAGGPPLPPRWPPPPLPPPWPPGWLAARGRCHGAAGGLLLRGVPVRPGPQRGQVSGLGAGGGPHVLRGRQWGPCGRLHPEAKGRTAAVPADAAGTARPPLGALWGQPGAPGGHRRGPVARSGRGGPAGGRGARGRLHLPWAAGWHQLPVQPAHLRCPVLQRATLFWPGHQQWPGPDRGQAAGHGRGRPGTGPAAQVRLGDPPATCHGLEDAVATTNPSPVVTARSQPLLKVRVTVTFQPQEIPAAAFDCQEKEVPKGEVARAQICFLSTKKTADNFGAQLSTTLRYQAALDPGRTVVRAVFGGSAAVRNGTLQLGVEKRCEGFAVAFTECPQDTLTPLLLRLTYDATGNPIQVAGGLRPALSEDSEMVAVGTLPFAKDCGTDNICIDDLQMSFNFSGLETIVVGMTSAVDVTVTLHNRGEDSYRTTVQLQHAEALSYRKAVVLQSSRRSMSVRCNSEPAEGAWRRTLCLVNHPIFRSGTKVVFTVTLDVPHDAELGSVLEVVANATSANGAPGSQAQRAEVPVKYDVFLVLTSAPDSTTYVNVSNRAGAPTSAPVTHHYEVKNLGQRSLPINVTFLVPTALGGTPLWDKVEVTPDQQELARCRVVAEHPGVPHDPQRLRERPRLDCAGAACRELQCQVQELEPRRALGFSLGGSLALGWLASGRQPKVVVVSSARLLYDVGRYWNTRGVTQLQVQTEVERLETPNPLPLILGGTVGGLVLLGLVALVLYKLGFFKRHYKELMESDGTPTAPLGDPQG